MPKSNRELASRISGGALSVRAPWGGLGTGVVVNRRILTAAHVVLPSDRSKALLQSLVYDVGIGRSRCPCKLAAFEERLDLAIRRPLETSVSCEWNSFSISSDAHIGDDIWIAGYPFGVDVPLVRRGAISSIVMPEEITVIDRDMFISRHATFPSYWLDVPVFEGNSGGPIINSEGDLIGIALQTLSRRFESGLIDPQTGEAQMIPVYLDIGVALRLDIALGALGLSFTLDPIPST